MSTMDPQALRVALRQLAEYGVPPPGMASVFDIGTKAFVEFFASEIVDGLVALGGATCRFFEGAHGSGKTHLLQLLEADARARGMAVVRLDLSQALSLHDWHLITQNVVQSMEVVFRTSVIRGLPNILERLGSSGVANEHELKVATLPHPGFKAAMVRALHPAGLSDEAWDRLSQYLHGERVGAGAFQRLGVFGVKNPLSKRNAERVLNTAVGGLYRLGLTGTMLLFDESEKTFDAVTRDSHRVRLAANLMRRLIDACFTGGLTGTVAIFTVLPGFLESCTMRYQALAERLYVMRGGPYQPTWRWPVLPVEEVGTVNKPEQFLSEAITRFAAIVQQFSGRADGLAARMQQEGNRVLRDNAGSGYRRPLMKTLAALAAERV